MYMLSQSTFIFLRANHFKIKNLRKYVEFKGIILNNKWAHALIQLKFSDWDFQDRLFLFSSFRLFYQKIQNGKVLTKAFIIQTYCKIYLYRMCPVLLLFLAFCRVKNLNSVNQRIQLLFIFSSYRS